MGSQLSKLFCLPFEKGSSLKEKEFALMGSKFFFFQSRPLFRSGLMCRKVNRKSQKLSPCYKMVKNLPNLSCPLKVIEFFQFERKKKELHICRNISVKVHLTIQSKDIIFVPKLHYAHIHAQCSVFNNKKKKKKKKSFAHFM